MTADEVIENIINDQSIYGVIVGNDLWLEIILNNKYNAIRSMDLFTEIKVLDTGLCGILFGARIYVLSLMNHIKEAIFIKQEPSEPVLEYLIKIVMDHPTIGPEIIIRDIIT